MADAARARGEETRRRILSATLDLIGEVGWANVSIRLIASRAAVNAALINYHFRSKDALLIEVASAGIAAAMAPALQKLVEEERPGRGLADTLRLLRELSAGPGGRVFMEMAIQAFRNTELRDLMGDALRQYRGLLAARLPGTEQERQALAIVLAAVIDGVLLHAGMDPSTDIDAAASALEDMVDRWVGSLVEDSSLPGV
jgi:AcrR family transcriptional regulator